eukprot:7061759-Pyramimonas_sp.AAC.2
MRPLPEKIEFAPSQRKLNSRPPRANAPPPSARAVSERVAFISLGGEFVSLGGEFVSLGGEYVCLGGEYVSLGVNSRRRPPPHLRARLRQTRQLGLIRRTCPPKWMRNRG